MSAPTTPRAKARSWLTPLQVLYRQSVVSRVGFLATATIVLFVTFSDFVSSPLPILCRYQGRTYVLPNITRPKALAELDCDAIAATPGSWQIRPLSCVDPNRMSTRTLRAPGSGGSLFGTDGGGREVFASLVQGSRVTLSFALFAAAIIVLVGTVLGAISGYWLAAFDPVISRMVEVVAAFPTLIIAIAVQTAMASPSRVTLLFAIGLSRWASVYQLVRAEVGLRNHSDFVLAARALGASPLRVLVRHIAPHVMRVAVVALTFELAAVVLAEAALAFLRAERVPEASWARILGEVRDHPSAWWLLVFPSVLVFASVLALQLFGEALRDALDPKEVA